jgi:hypothetical protein
VLQRGVELVKMGTYTAAVVEFAPKGSASDPASLITAVNFAEYENITLDVKSQVSES